MDLVCFFFQAEDGIRDADVTGVQTCALPISADHAIALVGGRAVMVGLDGWQGGEARRSAGGLGARVGSLTVGPAVIASFGDDVYLLPRILPDIPAIKKAGLWIKGIPPGISHPDRIHLG